MQTEITPSTLQTVLNFIQPLLLALVTAAVGYIVKKGNDRDKQLTSIQETGEANHALSNSAMAAQLTNAVEDAEQLLMLFKIISALRGNTPADTEAITAAQLKVDQRKTILQKHLAQQAVVDNRLPASVPSAG